MLPFIDNINSIQVTRVTQLDDLYEWKSELEMDVLKMPRILDLKG
jgi:hypothetical protein